MIGHERRDPPKAVAFVKADRFGLVDPRFEPQDRHVLSPGMHREMVEHRLAEAEAAQCGPYIHALQLAIFPVDELHPATSRQLISMAGDEERHAFAQQFLDAV